MIFAFAAFVIGGMLIGNGILDQSTKEIITGLVFWILCQGFMIIEQLDRIRLSIKLIAQWMKIAALGEAVNAIKNTGRKYDDTV